MNITYYLSTQNSKDYNNYYNNMITTIAKNGYINKIEYNYLNRLDKKKFKLINIMWIIDIINKINNNELINIIYLLFTDIFIINNNQLCINTDKIVNDIINTCNHNLSECQKKGIIEIINYLINYSENLFGFYGSAGTGKTYTLLCVANYLLKNNYISSISFVASTNKAVNVMKAIFFSYFDNKNNNELSTNLDDDKTIDFLTIHRLLNYKNDFDKDGKKIYIKDILTEKNNINIKNYELIIIDECSMIGNDLIQNLVNEINNVCKNIKNNMNKSPKIIFSGDLSQLMPCNEKISPVFISYMKCNYNYNNVNDIHTLDKLYNMKYYNMTTIVRNKLFNVVSLCNNIRQWVFDEVKIPSTRKYINNGVYLYKLNNNRLNSEWFHKYLTYIQQKDTQINSNIIITWTNKITDFYNIEIRKILYNYKENIKKFEIGDILIINDYYNKDINNKNNKFYTSEQIKITDINIANINTGKFDDILPKSYEKFKDFTIIEKLYKEIIYKLNLTTKRSYKSWILSVQKLSDIIIPQLIPEEYQIYVIHENDEVTLNEDIQKSEYIIKKFKNLLEKKFKINIEKYIIKRLWKKSNDLFDSFFCKINFGMSITTHKAQGSTYCNVFIDANDILQNKNENEAKRCLYTALTRASNSVHILI